MTTDSLFKWRHFLPEIILLNVRWYCRYSLSYRELEEMMAERGVEVDHSTIHRWVLKFAPELDKRIPKTLAMLIAIAVRNEMEDFHCKYLTDSTAR
jgi:transposase-like protein